MRILLVNKYYYRRGGTEIYVLELENLLKEHGHEVAVFSMKHSLNQNTEFIKYFPREIDLTKVTFRNFVTSIIRPFGSLEVRHKFNQLLREFNPDIVHLNNIHSQISPVLAILAKKYNVPVIWTLHDHKLLCPRYDCLRDNKSCELCFNSKYNVVKYKCMKNSWLASLIAYAEALRWNKKVISKYIDLFICPSTFLRGNLIKGGFNSSSLMYLPNFIDEKKLIRVNILKQNYYCFVGRLSPEKGIETLLKAAMELSQYHLKVIGTGPLENEIRSKYKAENIEFLGFRKWEELGTILANSRCMVLPSECYENNPLSIIEALCLGTPVIGSNIGGIPELINPGINGLTFEAGNIAHLMGQIKLLFQNPCNYNYTEIANKARAKYYSEYYFRELISLYNQLIFRHPSLIKQFNIKNKKVKIA